MSFRNFLGIVILSFYSPSLYINVMQKWRSWGLSFLLKFSILITFISSFILFILIARIDFNSPNSREIIEKIPTLKITHGKAIFIDHNLKSPVKITYPDSSKEVIILNLDSKNHDNYDDALILFTSEMIYFNILKGSPITLSYRDLLGDSDRNTINSEFLTDFIVAQQKNILGIILFLFVPLGSLIYFALTALKILFYAFVADVIMNLLKIDLTLKQLFRVMMISNIPSVVISNLFSFVFFNSSDLGIVEFIVSSTHILYFVGAIYIYHTYKAKGYLD